MQQNNKIQNESDTDISEHLSLNIPFDLDEEIDDEKFYIYIKECIKCIKSEWNIYGKLYLKKVITSFKKTENIFTFRRYLKEPFKNILTDFILYILTKENRKNSFSNSSLINKDLKNKEDKDKTFIGNKTKRNEEIKEAKENMIQNNTNTKKIEDKNNTMDLDEEKSENNEKENINNNSCKNNELKVNSEIKEKINNNEKNEVLIDFSQEINLEQEHKSIIDLFNFSAQRKCVELKDNSAITKKLLYEYLPKKTMISCLTSLLFILSGNSIKESFVSNELSSFCKNSKKKIFFIDMDKSFYSYTLYNGYIIINKEFFDLMNSQKEKIQIGSCNFLLSIFHEMAFLLSIKLINNLNLYSYYKYRKDIIEQTGEKLEEILLGRKRKMATIKGKKMFYTNFAQLPMKNVRYINNFKYYNNDYNRFRKNFELMYNDFHMNSGDKPDKNYFKYTKNDLSYERIDLKKGIFRNVKNFDSFNDMNKSK